MSDDLGQRMKGYEKSLDVRIVPHIPTILRVDGKAFHSYTKNCVRPFDLLLVDSFISATEDVYRHIHYDVAYGQSDEISFLIYRPDTFTQEDFDGRLFKLCSIMASAFTAHFNRYEVSRLKPPALFDCRVFQLPRDEVINYFIWRQNDAVRNSIQMLGQAHFSQKELHEKSCNDIQDMLYLTKGINWNDLQTFLKRGWCVDKYDSYRNIPIFTENRIYIEKYLLNKEAEVS